MNVDEVACRTRDNMKTCLDWIEAYGLFLQFYAVVLDVCIYMKKHNMEWPDEQAEEYEVLQEVVL